MSPTLIPFVATISLAVAALSGCATSGMQSGVAEPRAAATANAKPAPAAAKNQTRESARPVAQTAPSASPFTAAQDASLKQAVTAELDVVAAPGMTAIDLVDATDANTNFENLWERIRAGFRLAPMEGPFVAQHEQWFSRNSEYMERMLQRANLYLFHIVEEVDKRGLPTELALLPFVESAFNPQALSVAKASGMWQFIPSTGRDFGLEQNIFRDDRRDVLASTRAALDYLQRLHGEFNDWHLALAAYNWGEGNVRRAIARNQRMGLPADFASLRMPDETRWYVPKLQAVKNLVARPADFGITLPELANHPYFLSVPIERDLDVDLAARFAGLKVDEFKQLNPQLNKPVILAAGTPQLLLPYDNADAFVRNLKAHRGPLASWTAWVVPRTVRPADAAKRLGVTEAQLRELNRIPARVLVKAGSTLLVPRSAHRADDVSEHLADNATITLAPDVPPARRVSFKAGKRGDTVAAVAKRYRVSAAQVAQWNKVGVGSSFRPGQAIAVFVSGAAKAKAGGVRKTASVAKRPVHATKKVATRSTRARRIALR